MLETLSLDPCLAGGMGAFRHSCRDQGRKAICFSVNPDAGGGIRVGEERSSQQRGGQDDERDCKCIVHDFLKASDVPKLFDNNFNVL